MMNLLQWIVIILTMINLMMYCLIKMKYRKTTRKSTISLIKTNHIYLSETYEWLKNNGDFDGMPTLCNDIESFLSLCDEFENHKKIKYKINSLLLKENLFRQLQIIQNTSNIKNRESKLCIEFLEDYEKARLYFLSNYDSMKHMYYQFCTILELLIILGLHKTKRNINLKDSNALMSFHIYRNKRTYKY